MATTKGKSARRASENRRDDQTDVGMSLMGRRLGWVLAALAWVFVAVALATFDGADPPSHAVAVHNSPVANWCGPVGAALAWGAYLMLGFGVWAIVLGAGAALIWTLTGRSLTHPMVRLVGLVLIGLALSGFHGLLAPDLGLVAGANEGLAARFAVTELTARFSGFGAGVVLLATLIVGAVLAEERLLVLAPRAAWAATRRTATGIAAVWRRMAARPEAALETIRAAQSRASGVAAVAAGTKKRRAGSKKQKDAVEPGIDPDAGGLGAVESFDPEEHALADDEEWDEEDAWEDEDDVEDEYEYEYEDDDEAEDDDGADAGEAAPETDRGVLSPDELREKVAKLPLRMASRTQKVARDEDIPREENFEGYEFPTLELLEEPESNYSEQMEKIVREQAGQLEEALQTFRIDGEVVGIESGPSVTLYSVQLAPGTKVAKLQAVSSDVARALRAQNIRIVPNMVGKTSVGVEVPNLKKEKVRLKELMSGGHSEDMRLPMFLGKDSSGEPLVADLTRMPHMLIAGTTGSGKSVCMNTIIMSWLYTKRPDELKLVLVDPKMVEMSQFQHIPHLMCPVVTEMSKAAAILEWAVAKMEERYELFKEAMVRDIAAYNDLGEEELYDRLEPSSELEKAKIPKKLPYMVFIIDELADLMMTHKEVETSIVRIAQKARAVGIHLILATQRPQANVVTGLIKSNMPCRISFKVASGMDSRIVLDHKGAELLLGQGDMMILQPHTSEIMRSQGTLVTDIEIRKVAKFLKEVAGPNFERSLLSIRPGADDPFGGKDVDEEGLPLHERDPLFDRAVEIMIESGRGSVSLLQRRLQIGYTRASRLVDQMGRAGILGEHKGTVAREVAITMEDWEQMKALEAAETADGGADVANGAAPTVADAMGVDDLTDVERVRVNASYDDRQTLDDLDDVDAFIQDGREPVADRDALVDPVEADAEDDTDEPEVVDDADADPAADDETDADADEEVVEYEYVDADDEEAEDEDDPETVIQVDDADADADEDEDEDDEEWEYEYVDEEDIDPDDEYEYEYVDADADDDDDDEDGDEDDEEVAVVETVDTEDETAPR